MAAMLRGVKLKKSDGESFSSAELEGKYVVFYFGASWCGPCKRFLPELLAYHNHVTATRDDVTFVFVSLDKSAREYESYRETLPFASVPYKEQDLRKLLQLKCNIATIPEVAVVSPHGVLTTSNGRAKVHYDPRGLKFPYSLPHIRQCVGDLFIKADGSIEDASVFDGKYVALYFATQRVQPCQAFTPLLVEVYEHILQKDKPWEIVFVSGDKSESEFAEHLADMPWFAIPYEDRERIGNLIDKFGVTSVPQLIMLDPDFNLLNQNLKQSIALDPRGDTFPWKPKAITDLNLATLQEINTAPFLVILVEKENEIASTVELLSPVAVGEYERKDQGPRPLRFLVGCVDNKVGQTFRSFSSIGDEPSQCVFINVPEQQKAVSLLASVSCDAIQAVVDLYCKNELNLQPIRN